MVAGKPSLTLIATVLKLGLVVVDVSDEDGDLTDADQRLLRSVGGSHRQRVLALLLAVKALRGGDHPWGHRHLGTEAAAAQEGATPARSTTAKLNPCPTLQGRARTRVTASPVSPFFTCQTAAVVSSLLQRCPLVLLHW